jgi:hypothetical protein
MVLPFQFFSSVVYDNCYSCDSQIRFLVADDGETGNLINSELWSSLPLRNAGTETYEQSANMMEYDSLWTAEKKKA